MDTTATYVIAVAVLVADWVALFYLIRMQREK